MLFGRLGSPRSCSRVGVSSDSDLGLGLWYHVHVGECGRKITGRRSRRSDRGADDRRSICQDDRRLVGTGKQRSCPVRTVLHTMLGPVVMDPVSYAVLPGKEDVGILGSPTLTALAINVYNILDDKQHFTGLID